MCSVDNKNFCVTCKTKFNEFPQQFQLISSANQLNFLSKSIWITKPFGVTNADHHILWSMKTLSDHHKTLSHNILHRTVVEWSKNTQLRVCAYTRVRTREARTPHLPYFSCHPDVPLPNTTPSNSLKRKIRAASTTRTSHVYWFKTTYPTDFRSQTSDFKLQTSDFRPLLTRILVHGTFPFLPVVCGKTTFIYQCVVGCLIFYFECARFIWVGSCICQPINKAISCNLVAWCQHCDGC